MFTRGITRAAAAALSALTLTVLLGGCAAEPAPAETPVASHSASSPTVIPTPTPTPTASPLDARSAWTACAQVAQTEYVDQNPGSTIYPFSDSMTLQTAPDGRTFITVGVAPAVPMQGSGSIAVICYLSGTAEAPHVDSYTMKDI
jgi:hypothetical protein